MNIIVSEQQLKKIRMSINEVRGVAEASISYVNLIYQELERVIIHAVATNKKKFHVQIDFDLHEMIPFAEDNIEDFIEFPIEDIQIDFQLVRIKKYENVNGKTFSTGGAAYSISSKDEESTYLTEPSSELPVEIVKEVGKVLQAKFDFNVILYGGFDEGQMDEMLYDMRDTITHELNHMFEFYKRYESKGVEPMNIALSFAGSKNVNTPKKIFRVYEDFLSMLYYSEPWEVNANVQEALSKTQRMDFDEFRKTSQWEWANKMEDFNAEEFYNKLIQVTEERSPEAVDYHIRNLHKFFKKQYISLSFSYLGDEFEFMNNKILKTNNLKELFKNFESRIRNAGKKLKRNYMRLYSIEKD